MTNQSHVRFAWAFWKNKFSIKNRRRSVRKQEVADISKDDELDLLGDKDMESFAGSHADLEGVASKPGTSKQTDTLPPNTATNTQPSEHTDKPMELPMYGPSLPPWFRDAQSEHG